MEMETQKVVSALIAVYSTTPNSNSNESLVSTRNEANQYLTQYQRSPMAWEISNNLLLQSSNHIDFMIQTQIYFFAAQTLHTKCKSDMNQLPQSSYTSLRDSLLQHLMNYYSKSTTGSVVKNAHVGGSYYKPIVSRLAMALCSLSVQMSWYDIVDQLIALSKSSNPAGGFGILHTAANSADGGGNNTNGNIGLILEMAQLLPEEATSYRLLVQDRNIREGFIQGLIQKSNQVFEFYYGIVQELEQQQSQDPKSVVKIKEQILKCIHAWVRYIHLPPTLLQQSPLIEWTFSILQSYDMEHEYSNNADDNGGGGGNGDLFEVAVDVVIEILRCYPSDSEHNTGLVQKMIPLAMALAQQPISTPVSSSLYKQQTISTTTMSPFQKTVQTHDEDGMRAFCRIFTEMGESYMSLIMHHEDLNQVALVELVLNCSSLPDHGML